MHGNTGKQNLWLSAEGQQHNKQACDQLQKRGRTSMDQLQASLQRNLDYIRTKLGNSSDIVIRELRVGGKGEQRIALVYTDGLADQAIITDFMMESLLNDSQILQGDNSTQQADSAASQGAMATNSRPDQLGGSGGSAWSVSAPSTASSNGDQLSSQFNLQQSSQQGPQQ
ncbi:spore germination protein, partial [Paenibacillus sp. KS1]|uniref:spore germination protein n=1 Tax=Paenibacillus sp. KS1 TaxID=1849249 RepID=UPI0020C7B90B